MKILLTGARGFTGQHFTVAAQNSGHIIIPMSIDLTDVTRVRNFVQQNPTDAVVHLAALSSLVDTLALSYYNVNVLGTLNLLDALCTLDKSPSKVLLASSGNIYGQGLGLALTEKQTPKPVNHYAMSKLAMEHMACNYLDKLPIFFVRPFNYTGKQQKNTFVIPKLVQHFIHLSPNIELGNCDVEREFNDVRFVCEAYCRLLTKGVAGEFYNICSGKPVSLREVIAKLQILTNHVIEIKQNKAFMRANEIHRLCGDPTHLINTIGAIQQYSLEDTLNWMLAKSV